MWQCEGTAREHLHGGTAQPWPVPPVLLWWLSSPSPAPWGPSPPCQAVGWGLWRFQQGFIQFAHELTQWEVGFWEGMGPQECWKAERAPSCVLCALVGWSFLVFGVFGNLSNYVIQVYLLTFKRSCPYFEQCVSSLTLTHIHVSGKCFSTSKNQNSDLWTSAWKISFFKNDWACINYIWMQFYPCYQFEKAQPGSTTCTHMWLKCH